MNQSVALSTSWDIKPLSEVVEILDSRRVPVNGEERALRPGSIPYYGATGQVGLIDDYLFDEELVLLGEDGAPFLDSTKPKAYLISGKSWVNNHAHVLRAKKGMLNRFLLYQLNHTDFRPYVSGTTRLKLPQGPMKQILLVVPPVDVQHGIVAEIEKQFSRLDEAVASLKRAQANLKRYKAAVLKAAVEGKLTEQWRKDHPNVEPASELLKRILAERRAKWEEAELAKMKAKGKVPKDDKWKARYEEPAASDPKDLPKLPEGWVWATLDQVVAEMTNGYGKRSEMAGQPHIVLRLADIASGQISLADVRRINCTEEDLQKYALSEGDLLVLRVNGSGDLVGRFVSVHGTPEPTLFCDHFIRLQCASHDFGAWLRVYSDGERFRRFIDLNKVSSAGQNTISQGELKAFAVPLPPTGEQRFIFAEINRRLSLLSEITDQLGVNLHRTARLSQGILRKAFSGEAWA